MKKTQAVFRGTRLANCPPHRDPRPEPSPSPVSAAQETPGGHLTWPAALSGLGGWGSPGQGQDSVAESRSRGGPGSVAGPWARWGGAGLALLPRPPRVNVSLGCGA